jgi:hypothetical protein
MQQATLHLQRRCIHRSWSVVPGGRLERCKLWTSKSCPFAIERSKRRGHFGSHISIFGRTPQLLLLVTGCMAAPSCSIALRQSPPWHVQGRAAQQLQVVGGSSLRYHHHSSCVCGHVITCDVTLFGRCCSSSLIKKCWARERIY